MTFWRRQRRATPQELLVASAILQSSQDDDAELLYQQLARCDSVVRRRSETGVVITVPQTTEDLLVDIDVDLTSAWVSVDDVVSRARREFRVRIARGGFFAALEGRSKGQSWPSNWRVDETALRKAVVGALQIPMRADCRELQSWLGFIGSLAELGVRCHAPATSQEIEQISQSEGVKIPDELGRLLSITNGMVLPGLTVFGTSDLYVSEIDGAQWWVISLDGEDAHLVGNDGSTVYQAEGFEGDLRPVAESLKMWLVELLEVSP